MGSAVTYGELARLSSEELPPRIALSSIASAAVDPLAHTLVRHEHGTTVAYACQFRQNAGNPPLLVFLGLASADPGHTTTCVPAAVFSR